MRLMYVCHSIQYAFLCFPIFSVDLQEQFDDSFGYGLENGTFTGTIGRLISLKSEVAFTSFFIKDYLTRAIDFTPSLYSDDLCCIVRKAEKKPASILPLLCFDPLLWIVLLVGIFFCAGVWIIVRMLNESKPLTELYLMQKRNTKNRISAGDRFNRCNNVLGGPKYLQYLQILIDCFIISLSAPVRRFPRVSSERIFISAICLISLIFVSMFQSRLSAVFITPVYYEDINTLAQLDKSNLFIELKYQAMLDDLFPENSTEMIERLSKKLKLVTSAQSVMARVARDGGVATVTRKSTTKLDNSIYFTKNQLNLVKECPRIYNLGFVYPKHSVFATRINEVLLDMVAGGLIDKFIREMYFNTTLSNVKQFGSYHIDSYKVFTLTDLQLAFYILGVGIIISGLFLLFEFVSVRYVYFIQSSLRNTIPKQ